MADDPQIIGFDATDVRNGLRLAMRVGMPPLDAEQPVFFMPRVEQAQTEAVDANDVPFDPDYTPVRQPPDKKTGITCAIEYFDGQGTKLEGLGIVAATKVVLTLLDEEWAEVEGFEFVVISGLRFFYRRVETTKGLVSVGLYKVHCAAEDQG